MFAGKTDRELFPGLMCNFIVIDFLLWKFFPGSWELELVLGDLAAVLLFFSPFYESGRPFPKPIHILSSLPWLRTKLKLCGIAEGLKQKLLRGKGGGRGLKRKKENGQRKKTRGRKWIRNERKNWERWLKYLYKIAINIWKWTHLNVK